MWLTFQLYFYKHNVMYIIYKDKGGGSPDDEMWNLTSCTTDFSNLLVTVQDTGHRTIEALKTTIEKLTQYKKHRVF